MRSLLSSKPVKLESLVALAFFSTCMCIQIGLPVLLLSTHRTCWAPPGLRTRRLHSGLEHATATSQADEPRNASLRRSTHRDNVRSIEGVGTCGSLAVSLQHIVWEAQNGPDASSRRFRSVWTAGCKCFLFFGVQEDKDMINSLVLKEMGSH